jgi:hypothetical protein
MTPEVKFDPATQTLSLSGNSYPPDVASFYQPLLETFDQYVESGELKGIKVEFLLNYVNSTSIKFMLMLLERFIPLQSAGHPTQAVWYYNADDDDILGAGEDMLPSAPIPFTLQVVEKKPNGQPAV